jgi:dTDP-4-amino-4,6-dideoxygalactose transaminase
MNAYSLISAGAAAGELKEMLEKALACSRQRPALPIAFIEQKLPDFAQLAEILRLSANSCYWTNFGPVSSLLESALERYLNLPPSRAVVMCSSGTAALLALIALKEHRAGRSLQWAISAYGFRSTGLGPLASATVLDCDDQGLLDLETLAGLDPDTWDGAVLTNVFGLRSELRDYVGLCRDMGKELIVDSAGLLQGFSRENERWSVDEILSFHQTKPWGMGEGGCAIVDRENATILRAFMNCGDGLDKAARAGAANCKISDFSCALILQRLLRAPEWCSAYQEQARRVLEIAAQAGLRPLAPLDLSVMTPPHLPMLSPHPISERSLTNEMLVIRKYYKPLTGLSQNAWTIYEHIVNIPCHPDMAALRDEEIGRCLENIVSASL